MDEDVILQEIQQIIMEFNLEITLKTTLSTMKGSIHYHLKLGKSPGLLELTYWPLKKKIWIEIHNNRKANWNEGLIGPLSDRIAEHFSGELVKNGLS